MCQLLQTQLTTQLKYRISSAQTKKLQPLVLSLYPVISMEITPSMISDHCKIMILITMLPISLQVMSSLLTSASTPINHVVQTLQLMLTKLSWQLVPANFLQTVNSFQTRLTLLPLIMQHKKLDMSSSLKTVDRYVITKQIRLHSKSSVTLQLLQDLTSQTSLLIIQTVVTHRSPSVMHQDAQLPM